MKVAFGCDPNAADFKKVLMAKAELLGHEVFDLGSDDPIYANVAFEGAERVVAGEFDRGVVVCGTGLGISIAANKVKGAYCACIHDVYQAERAVLSNNANMIAMGSQVIGEKLGEKLLKEYLSYTFDPTGRSAEKVAAITNYEAK